MANDTLAPVFPLLAPSSPCFSDEQERALDEWFAAGKPGEPHEWLGMSKAAYEATREALRERARQFVKSSRVQQLFARSFARRVEEQMRWEDDGGPPLPDGFELTRDFKNLHLRPDFVAMRLF